MGVRWGGKNEWDWNWARLLLLVAVVSATAAMGVLLTIAWVRDDADVPPRVVNQPILPPTALSQDIPVTWDGKTTTCDVGLDWDGKDLAVALIECDKLITP